MESNKDDANSGSDLSIPPLKNIDHFTKTNLTQAQKTESFIDWCTQQGV